MTTRVLHVVPSFYPAIYWGGPIFSTKALCDGVAKVPGYEVEVLTTDAAGPRVEERLTVSKDEYFGSNGYTVTYARRVAGHSISVDLLLRLPSRLRRADVVHLSGTYNFPTLFVFFFARLAGKPVVWSPRGALQATQVWNDSPRKRLKYLFEKAVQLLRPKNTVLLVTSEEEGRESTTRLRDISVHVVPNSVDIPQTLIHRRSSRTDAYVSLLFIGRLHPKKGIEVLLDAMRELPSEFRLKVFGTGARDYVDKLIISAADLGDRVEFGGMVSGNHKMQAYQNADIFVLPSYSENFGIVVAEALASGTPVITTKFTPWQKINEVNCGRCIDLISDKLSYEISELAKQDLLAMGDAGRAWMKQSFSQDVMTQRIIEVYESVL